MKQKEDIASHPQILFKQNSVVRVPRFILKIEKNSLTGKKNDLVKVMGEKYVKISFALSYLLWLVLFDD